MMARCGESYDHLVRAASGRTECSVYCNEPDATDWRNGMMGLKQRVVDFADAHGVSQGMRERLETWVGRVEAVPPPDTFGFPSYFADYIQNIRTIMQDGVCVLEMLEEDTGQAPEVPGPPHKRTAQGEGLRLALIGAGVVGAILLLRGE